MHATTLVENRNRHHITNQNNLITAQEVNTTSVVADFNQLKVFGSLCYYSSLPTNRKKV